MNFQQDFIIINNINEIVAIRSSWAEVKAYLSTHRPGIETTVQVIDHWAGTEFEVVGFAR